MFLNAVLEQKCLDSLLMTLLLAGCAAFQAGQPAVGDEQAQTEGQKNLAAIRAMIADERRRVSELGRSPEKAPTWPPDWDSSYSLPSVPKHKAAPYVPRSSAPLTGSSSSSPDVTAKIPWSPERSPQREIEPTRQVPPYTYVVPPGPIYPGRMRCVPDMLGGQRCQTQ